MSILLPKLRNDLLFSRQGREGQITFVVKDPVTNQFFSLQEAEQFIATQLDGTTPLETIRQRVEARFDLALSPSALTKFVNSLDEFQLLESGSSQTKRLDKPGIVRGSLLYLRVKLFDPDAMFNRLVGRVRFCFTRGFVVAAAATILWGFVIFFANWDDFRMGIVQLINWRSLFLLWTTMCMISTAHEFAHGLTCKYFGGQVREVGFLLIYFQPAFYCNVSDAWLFPEKRKRFAVGFAGPYFELFLWACAVLLWRLTDVETWVNRLALAAMATSGIKTLINFNPLLKLDGYYLLSDLLDAPNLRRQAYSYIGDGMKRLVGLEVTEPTQIQPGKRWIFVAYGLVSAVMSIFVLGFAVVKLGGFLVANRQPEALLLATGLLVMKVRRRFRRLFGKSPDDAESDGLPAAEPMGEAPPEQAGAPAASQPASNGVPAVPQPARRSRKRSRVNKRLLVIAACLALALPILFFGRMKLRIAGAFVVLPIQNADVRAEVPGTIEEIRVDEGDWVHPGDVIARLSDRDNRAALTKAEADLAQMKAQLRLLQAGTRPEEIELARITAARAEDRWKFAQNNLKRDEQLLQEKLISQKDFEASKQAVVDSQDEVAEARQRLQVLHRGHALAGVERDGWARGQRRRFDRQGARVEDRRSPDAGFRKGRRRHQSRATGRAQGQGISGANLLRHGDVGRHHGASRRRQRRPERQCPPARDDVIHRGARLRPHRARHHAHRQRRAAAQTGHERHGQNFLRKPPPDRPGDTPHGPVPQSPILVLVVIPPTADFNDQLTMNRLVIGNLSLVTGDLQRSNRTVRQSPITSYQLPVTSPTVHVPNARSTSREASP